MRAAVLVACWVAVSVPVALVVAAAARGAKDADLADEVERYLRSRGRVTRLVHRPVAVVGLAVVLVTAGVVLAKPLSQVTERVYTAASGTRALLRGEPVPAPTPTSAPLAPEQAPADPPVAEPTPADDEKDEDEGAEDAPTDGTIVAGGILGGPTDSSRWARPPRDPDEPDERADDEAAAPAEEGAPADGDEAPRPDRTDEAEAPEEPDGEAESPPADEPIADPPPQPDDGGAPGSSEPPTDDDVDGDGIPNAEDDDVDGDGIVNAEDEDVDGDGIVNADDDAAPTNETQTLGSESATDVQVPLKLGVVF